MHVNITNLVYYCSYRPAEEVKAVRDKSDPIKLLEAYAIEGNLVTPEELKVITLSYKSACACMCCSY